MKEALLYYREAMRLEPSNLTFYDNLLFALNYDADLSAEEIYGEYAAYGRAAAALKPQEYEPALVATDSGRRVRIGYSSPDFKSHVCRFFMEPIFSHHDRSRFELYAYANVTNPDSHTERLKQYFDHWVDVRPLNDEQMAQRIFDDGIDILVDLAGHTKGNRLPVFAMTPAPIQVAFLTGCGYTTGLKEVDYLIGDENVTPVGCEAYFSERIWRMPAPFLCYEPPREVTPEVLGLPALRNGYVTFGSLARTVRLNDRLLKVWRQILERVPGSKLRLDQKPFSDERVRETFLARLEGVGISRDRVELMCSSPHWDAYQAIDITLDCFPHNAGTTTIESLWMGVPVLSKLDRPSVGRIGAVFLKALGLEDWLVQTEQEYIEKAVTLTSDLQALSKLRSELRLKIEHSALIDGAGFTKKLEACFLDMIKQVNLSNVPQN